MTDREKIIKGLHQHCKGSLFDRCGECPYYVISDEQFSCRDKLLEDVIILLKEQEEREKRICKKICDIIRSGCSTDTDDDKNFVCHEIQKCFMEGSETE